MAIEKMGMTGGAPMREPMDSETDYIDASTATIPAALLAGKTVAPGDVIRLEVVSADGDEIAVKYSTEDTGGDNLTTEPSTIDKATALFDEKE